MKQSKLKKHVESYLKEWESRGYYDKKGFIEDIMHGGCASGIVSHLIYYHDTLKFYKKYKAEINQMLTEIVDDTGDQPAQLFRNWDKSDPLAIDTANQNLLAWFGFEETVNRIYREKYENR